MEENFRRKVLSNGFTVIFEKRDVPVVSVAFAVRQGGINETMDEKGISHFIEHMLFKGTEKRSVKQISYEIEKNGGKTNAFTSEEITAYWCKMPSKHLDVALDVISDIVKNPKFDESELEKERQVIFEEMNMYKDNPRLHVFDEVQKCLYDGSLSVSIIGTKESMNSIDRNKMKEKFASVYKPNQMMLCVVGDADFEEIVKFAEENFSSEDRAEIHEEPLILKNESKVEERVGVDQANLILAYHVPLAQDPKSDVAFVLNAVMSEGMSSRLFSEIREKRNLAYAVKGGSQISKRFAYNYIYVGTNKESVEKVKELILDEFDKVSKDLDEKELNEVKEQLIGLYQISMEDSESQMVELLSSELHGNAEDFYKFEEKIRAVKLEEVKEMASKVRDTYSFYALVPKN